MLWKLLKYDFRSMWKQFAIAWPAALVLGLINRFTLDGRFSTSDVGGVTSVIMISLFVGVLFAMFVVSMVFILTRFYRGLLGDEGYLMHTLPVQSWQLVLSKLICALAVSILNGVVAVLAMVLMVPVDWTELLHWRVWKFLLQGIIEQPDFALYLVELCVVIAAGLAAAITMCYLSMAIGHLFHRRRVLMSVVAFFALDIAASLLGSLDIWPEINLEGHSGMWLAALICLIPAILMFLGTSYILKNHLNLD